MGQNLGARNIERAKKGIKLTLLIAAASCVLLGIPLVAFPAFFARFFNKDANVIYYASTFLRMMSPFYFLCAINQVLAGSLRGAGDSKAPMVIMLSSFVAFRQLYLFVFSRLFDSFYVVALAYPMGWILCSALMVIYYKKSNWETRFLNRQTQ